MKKKDVIKILSEAEPASGIMEVICDIASNGQVCYPNESILVMLWGYGDDDRACDDDQIINSKHYTICNGIKDFRTGVVYGHSAARKAYCNYYVSEFREVREFVSDFRNEPCGTTTEEYLKSHPGTTLVPAPITGGADIQLSDYMDSMCTALSVGKVPVSAVFSYHHSIVLLKQTNSEISIRELTGYLSGNTVKGILDDLFEHMDEDWVAGDYEDGTVDFFITKSGNVFMPEYIESRENLHNHGYIRCIHVEAKGKISEDITTVRKYMERDNDTPGYDGVCTTERIGNDIKFNYWYKEESK